MTHNISTQRGRILSAVLNAVGALALMACLLALMLAYFDVL